MPQYRARILISLKKVVLDPQGQTVQNALQALGFHEVDGVRVGKAISLSLEADDLDGARSRVQEMCERLLANPVIEEFKVEVSEA